MLKKYLSYYKRLLYLAIPLTLTQAGQMVVQLVDNAMVGHVGTTELAAAAFANSIFVIILCLGIGIFIGITPLIGHAFGAKEKNKIYNLINDGHGLTFFIAIFLTVFAWGISYLMPYFNQPEEIQDLAISYYRILCVSLIPFSFFSLYKQIGEGLSNTKLAMIATISSNLVNVVLNYMLIYGKWGMPTLGLNGAGYATLISRFLMAIFIMLFFIKNKKYTSYFKQLNFFRIRLKGIIEIFNLGFPIAIQIVVEVLAFSSAAIMMGWISKTDLAAHQIAIGLASLTFMAANGISQAVTIRVSYQLGENRFSNLRKVSNSGFHIIILYMAICGLLFYLFRNYIPLIFTADPIVIKKTTSLLIIAAIFQLFDGFQITALGILRGLKDVRLPMLISVFSYIVVGLSVSYICAFNLNLGGMGIWIGFVFGIALSGLFLGMRIKNRFNKLLA